MPFWHIAYVSQHADSTVLLLLYSYYLVCRHLVLRRVACRHSRVSVRTVVGTTPFNHGAARIVQSERACPPSDSRVVETMMMWCGGLVSSAHKTHKVIAVVAIVACCFMLLLLLLLLLLLMLLLLLLLIWLLVYEVRSPHSHRL